MRLRWSQDFSEGLSKTFTLKLLSSGWLLRKRIIYYWDLNDWGKNDYIFQQMCFRFHQILHFPCILFWLKSFNSTVWGPTCSTAERSLDVTKRKRSLSLKLNMLYWLLALLVANSHGYLSPRSLRFFGIHISVVSSIGYMSPHL